MATDSTSTAQSPLEPPQPDTPAVPQVSIGMPVYNGEPFIREALGSLLGQTFTDFELIISDNASTDATEAICREYAAKDKRIRYVRQPANLGAIANFQFVLDEAVGEYFMWACHDDCWGELFIVENISFLMKNTSYIGSISQSVNHRNEVGVQAGGTPINQADKWDRLQMFLTNPGSNSSFYSLWKRSCLTTLILDDFNYVAGDLSLMSELLKVGKINCTNESVQFYKGAGLSANTVKYFDSARTNFIEFIFPYYVFSRYLVKCGFFRKRTIFCAKLILFLNMRGFFAYWRQKAGTMAWFVVSHKFEDDSFSKTLSDGEKAREALRIFLRKIKSKFMLINDRGLRWAFYILFYKYIHPFLGLEFSVFGRKVEAPIDVVIPALEQDSYVLPLTIASIRIHIKNPVSRIYIVGPKSEVLRKIAEVYGAVFVDEIDVAPIQKEFIHYNPSGVDRAGWLLQQLIKLSADNIASQRYILVMDADTYFVRQRYAVCKGRVIFDCSDEYHFPYRANYHSLLGEEPRAPLSFISHCMVFDSQVLRELRDVIESIHGVAWYEAIIKTIDKETVSGFSEYETYGNYVFQHYRNRAFYRYWFNESLKGNIFSPKFRRTRAISKHYYQNKAT